MGRCSPFKAELWGILDELLILLSKGYKQATIQTNNLEVVKPWLLRGQNIWVLLRRIQRIINSEGQWEIKYVPKDYNLIAD